jgi:bacterioferritin-associated ferredoxin
MIVCICNAISQRRIDRVIADGANSVEAVFDACGSTPCCGKCRPEIADMLDDRAGGPPPLPVMTRPAEATPAARLAAE